MLGVRRPSNKSFDDVITFVNLPRVLCRKISLHSVSSVSGTQGAVPRKRQLTFCAWKTNRWSIVDFTRYQNLCVSLLLAIKTAQQTTSPSHAANMPQASLFFQILQRATETAYAETLITNSNQRHRTTQQQHNTKNDNKQITIIDTRHSTEQMTDTHTPPSQASANCDRRINIITTPLKHANQSADPLSSRHLSSTHLDHKLKLHVLTHAYLAIQRKRMCLVLRSLFV